jgi:hypothetical protein
MPETMHRLAMFPCLRMQTWILGTLFVHPTVREIDPRREVTEPVVLQAMPGRMSLLKPAAGWAEEAGRAGVETPELVV